MYAYLHGILADVEEDNCVIDINGIGYNVKVSPQTIFRMPGIGETVKLYTYTSVREDAFMLYGFLSKADLEMFKKVITVNGIGPKGGLSLLSHMDADSLRFAILSEDVKTISQAPGIGKKTAERIILDLKDKLPIDAGIIATEIAQGQIADEASAQIAEAIEALTALGYGKAEATRAVRKVEDAENMDSGALLGKALKYLY